MSNITTWLIRGDTHGGTNWINNQLNDYQPEQTAIIILGDAGFNFYLNKNDIRTKREIEDKKYYIYCVRGNHEARPQSLDFMIEKWDYNVNGYVYYEAQFPHIRYFKDYGIYTINGYRCLVLSGAYSVDKWYRLNRVGLTEETNNPKQTGWFADECLTEEEMAEIDRYIDHSGNYTFDFVFSHTCPKKYQPVDLFLSSIDQSTVDSSMEIWMDKLSEKIVVNIAWLYGHYHKDRIEKPHVEQYFNYIENLDIIAKRWKKYDETNELDWWLEKSPNFYME